MLSLRHPSSCTMLTWWTCDAVLDQQTALQVAQRAGHAAIVVYCTFAFLSCRTSFASEASGALIMFASIGWCTVIGWCTHHPTTVKGTEEGRDQIFLNTTLSFVFRKKTVTDCRYPTLFSNSVYVTKTLNTHWPPQEGKTGQNERSHVTSLIECINSHL